MAGRRAGREEGLQRLLSTDELESLRPRLDGLIASLSPGLQSLPADTPFEVVLAALARDGAVVVNNAVSDVCADACVEEIAPYVDEVGYGDDFLGALPAFAAHTPPPTPVLKNAGSSGAPAACPPRQQRDR